MIRLFGGEMLARASPAERSALRFTALILFAVLALQRLGLPFAGKAFSMVGPIGLAIVVYGLATGALQFHRGRLVNYLIFLALVLMGTAYHAAFPGGFGSGVNINSLLQFLVLTSFAIFTFAAPVEEGAFFRLVTFALVLVAVAGILQFVAQFAGLRLFSFTGLIPDSLLYEAGYNLEIPVGIGSIMKSNGFVLVEPSVFSQLMAVGLIIEAVGTRRARYLAAFVAGLLLSFSGTGWIVLGAFVLGSAVAMGKRGLVIAIGVVAMLAAVLGLAAVLAPDFVGALGERLSEINRPGTSGHMRFITPFWLLGDVTSSNPVSMLLGIGSGESEKLTLPFDYDVNTPIKVMVEYGAPALIAYVLLFVLGRKTRIQAALVLPLVVLFMFAGGYQQFPPMLFFVLLLTSVARLRPADASRAVQPPEATPRPAMPPGRAVPAAR